MNPKCAKCSKTVYPMEKLNCLDQFWHKTCFKCEVCQMTLNMKTYKGYNKRPYCNPHYPTTKFTAVSDTPENLRLAKQSKEQSLLEYHKDFEKEKGIYTAVTDDPETLRIKKNTENISNVKYTGASAEMRCGTSERGAIEAGIEGVNPHQPGYEQYRQYRPPEPTVQHQLPPQQPPPQQLPPQHKQPIPSKPRYRAIYDYTAADEDEVSFVEGDLVTDATIIDEGWMEGRIERTGQYGMIPANYVEQV